MRCFRLSWALLATLAGAQPPAPASQHDVQAALFSQTGTARTVETRNGKLTASGSDWVDRVLTWLPSDTEALAVAAQAFDVTLDGSESQTALASARSFFFAHLESAAGARGFEHILGLTVRRAALAGRKFDDTAAPPRRTGMVPYQGCALLLFTQPLPLPPLRRPADENIMGHRVWTHRNGTVEDLLTLLEPDLLLACNHRRFFEEVVTRRSSPTSPRALPDTLREWTLVNRQAPLWGLAHYAGPPSTLAAAAFGQDPAATGAVIEFGPVARARLLAKHNPWQNDVTSPDFHGAAATHQPTAGLWELSVAPQSDAALVTVMTLMAAIGFIVVI